MPVDEELRGQPSLEIVLEIAGQFELGRQPGFAAATEQTSTVVQPCSTYKPSWGVPQAATRCTHRGPKPHQLIAIKLTSESG